MSLYGADVPLGFTVADTNRRRKVWEIVAEYVLSEQDISTVRATPQHLVDLWLTTFTNSQKGIIANLFVQVKLLMALRFFTTSGSVPSPANAALIGLKPGATILNRKVLMHYCVAIS